MIRVCALLTLLFFIPAAHSFHLPAMAAPPQNFFKGDPLKVKVKKLTSVKTQRTYSYYSLAYCKPDKIVDSAENIWEVIRGDHIQNSPYLFYMREPQMCKILCRLILNAERAKDLKEKIDHEYRVNMILGNIPLVIPFKRPDIDSFIYQHGFHVGYGKGGKHFIHNHLSFTVKYHKDDKSDAARVVGFEVKPFSVKHEFKGRWIDNRLEACDPSAKKTVTSSESPQEVEANKEIIFTYDVEFQESDTKSADNQIDWFSIINS